MPPLHSRREAFLKSREHPLFGRKTSGFLFKVFTLQVKENIFFFPTVSILNAVVPLLLKCVDMENSEERCEENLETSWCFCKCKKHRTVGVAAELLEDPAPVGCAVLLAWKYLRHQLLDLQMSVLKERKKTRSDSTKISQDFTL